MAEEDAKVKEEHSNSCCIAWEGKYAKLKERYSKLEDGRNALRKGLSIYEQQISKMQSENLTLKKAYESEKVRANNESEEKAKESALRASLESEVGSLKSNILLLQQNTGPASQDLEKEMVQLREVLSKQDAEVSRLKELLENERIRADSEKKKAEAERKKTDELRKKLKSEKTRADKERSLVDVERKKAEENRLRLETMMKDADELKLKLTMETSKSAEFKKKLEMEVQNRMKDIKRADSSASKAAEKTKLADTNLKIAMDEKRRADELSQQLDQHRQKIEIFKKEIVELKSSRKLVDNEAKENLALLEMNKLEDQRKAVEAYKKKAADEKCRADKLSHELKDNKLRLEELQKEIHALISSRSFVSSPLHLHDRSSKYQTAEMRFLKKQLKLEKMMVKHSKEGTELEKARNCILQEELQCLKQDFSQFSKRLNILDICCGEGIHDLEKVNLNSKQFGVEPYQMHSHLKDGHARIAGGGETDSFRENIEGSASLIAISGGNDSRNVSGIDSKLEPLLKGFNRKVLQSSAINSSSTSFSDRPLVGSQERRTSGATSAKFAEDKSSLPESISRLSCYSKEKCNENHTTIVENSVISTEKRGRHQKKRKRAVDAIESFHSKGNKLLQISEKLPEKLPLLHAALENQTDKSERVERCLLSDVQGNTCSLDARSYKKRKVSFEEQTKCQLNDANREQANVKLLGMKESDIHAKSVPPVHHLSETAQDWKDSSDALGDFELVVGDNYMKLLDLDNNVDEESYRLAVEMPLSPTLPQIQCRSSDALRVSNSYLLSDNNSLGESSHLEENLVPLGHFDVIDMEIDSNTAKLGTLTSSKNSSLQEISGHADTSSYLCGIETDHPKITHVDKSASLGESLGMPNERSKISGGSSDFCGIGTDHSKITHFDISTPFGESLGMPDKSACENESSKISGGSSGLCGIETHPSKITHIDVSASLGKSLGMPNESACANERSKISGASSDLCSIGTDHSKITHVDISVSLDKSLGMPDKSACADERSKISFGSSDLPSCHRIPKCYVLFSDNDKDESISRIYSATNNFMARCSLVSSSNLFAKNIVVFILSAQDLSAKEKASVFLSLLLHYISEIASRDFRNAWDRDLAKFISSFAQHIYAELSDESTGKFFVESCNLHELFALLEDFILHKKVLMLDGDALSGSKPSNNSRINFLVMGNGVNLFSQAASVHLLQAGGILLASLCAAADHIGFICEASFNILRMSRSDTSFALRILHIFAYICGPEYFSVKEYCFVMAVVRSLVILLENKHNPPEQNSCFPSLAEDLANIWSDSKCPFYEGTFSMDVIATMLLDNLQNCAWSSAKQKDLVNAERTGGNACFLVDVLALVELVACFMSWDWTVENIVCPVFKMLESRLLEHVPAAIPILLAQLGRFGVSANGYEDTGVQNLRTRLSALLCQCNSKTVGLDIQFSIGIALLGLVPLNFEDIVESTAEITEFESQSDPAVCLRKWFSLFSNEYQLSFRNLVSLSKSQQNGHIPLLQ